MITVELRTPAGGYAVVVLRGAGQGQARRADQPGHGPGLQAAARSSPQHHQRLTDVARTSSTAPSRTSRRPAGKLATLAASARRSRRRWWTGDIRTPASSRTSTMRSGTGLWR
jgi:hypothetical protein